MQQKITDDLEALLTVLPPPIEASLRTANKGEDLLEIILDLGYGWDDIARLKEQGVIL